MIKEKKKIVDEYIRVMGFKVGRSEFENGKEKIIELGLSNSYQERDKMNIKYFMELEKAIPNYPRKFEYISNKRFF